MKKPGPAQLSIYKAGKQVQVAGLELDTYELGRADSNALSFPGTEGLSRKHAAFECNGTKWSVRDLGSTNGTFVNGVRITAAQNLSSGDQVMVGELSIVFTDLSAAEPPQVSFDRTVLFVENPNSPTSTSVQTTLDGVLRTDKEIQSSPHMKALLQAGRELCSHVSLNELFRVILDLSVETVGAARGVLITIESEEFQVRASKGAGFRISSYVRDLVVKERRSLLVRDALTDEALASRMSIVQEQIRGILAVPLQAAKAVIGLIYLDSPVDIREFTKDDLNVLTVLANIAAIRIEQARLTEIEQAEKLHAKELEHAALIQRSILPLEVPPFPKRKDFDLHADMIPAKEVGGDFFDFFLLDVDHLGFVVGDVCGKGVPAALFMAVTRTLLRATAQHQKGPGECFTYMNRTLAERNDAGMLITLFYGVLNTKTGELQFANAGHNPPYIFSKDGELRQLSEQSGPMLGMLDSHEYRTLTVPITAGQGILVYTDGVTEAINKADEFFEEKRLQDYLAAHVRAKAQPLVQGLFAALQEFAKGAPQADDITVLALEYLEHN